MARTSFKKRRVAEDLLDRIYAYVKAEAAREDLDAAEYLTEEMKKTAKRKAAAKRDLAIDTLMELLDE